MKQEVCLLPVRCRGCGSKFDLWHELREQESLETLREQGEIRRAVNQLFCWHCRKAVSGELETEESEEEPDTEELEMARNELDFSLAF